MADQGVHVEDEALNELFQKLDYLVQLNNYRSDHPELWNGDLETEIRQTTDNLTAHYPIPPSPIRD